MGGGNAIAVAELGVKLAAALAAAVGALDTPPEVPGDTPIAQVADAAAVVEQGATKIQILFAAGPSTTTSVCRPGHLSAVCAMGATEHTLHPGPSPSTQRTKSQNGFNWKVGTVHVLTQYLNRLV
jgi:hypothetical protein